MIQERSDPVIDEVREIRQRISARVDHDPSRLVAYYMTLQERHRDRLIDRSGAEPVGTTGVAGPYGVNEFPPQDDGSS